MRSVFVRKNLPAEIKWEHCHGCRFLISFNETEVRCYRKFCPHIQVDVELKEGKEAK